MTIKIENELQLKEYFEDLKSTGVESSSVFQNKVRSGN